MSKKLLKKILLILILFMIVIAIVLLMKNINNKSEKYSQSKENSGEILTISTGETVDFENIVEITDNYFIEQTNDVFYNIDEYIGKSIKIEGYVYSYEDFDNGNICHAVVRNTPGCCGADGLAGLDIRSDKKYPAEDTWVEVIGIVGLDTVMGSEIPVIQVASITKKEEGSGFVTN